MSHCHQFFLHEVDVLVVQQIKFTCAADINRIHFDSRSNWLKKWEQAIVWHLVQTVLEKQTKKPQIKPPKSHIRQEICAASIRVALALTEKKAIWHWYVEIETHFSNTCLSLVPAIIYMSHQMLKDLIILHKWAIWSLDLPCACRSEALFRRDETCPNPALSISISGKFCKSSVNKMCQAVTNDWSFISASLLVMSCFWVCNQLCFWFCNASIACMAKEKWEQKKLGEVLG